MKRSHSKKEEFVELRIDALDFVETELSSGQSTQFRMEYRNADGSIANYYPDLLVKRTDSETDDAKVALRDQEFYELRLYDSESDGEPKYCVRQARARWSDETGEVVWDEEQTQLGYSLRRKE